MHIVLAVLEHCGYLAIFAAAFLSAGYLPVPGALVAAVAGGLIGSHVFGAPATVAAVVCGAVAGDCGRYGISRLFTSRRTWNARDARFRSLRRLDDFLKARPFAAVAGSRFMPMVKGGVDSLSGMGRLAFWKFLAGAFAGDLAYAAVFLSLGLFFGRGWGDDRVAAACVSGLAFLIGTGVGVGAILFPGLGKAQRAFKAQGHGAKARAHVSR